MLINHKFFKILLSILIPVFVVALLVYAFNGPSTSPPNGGGTVYTDTSGNVGVGTTTPSYKLDVVGDARVSGTFHAGALDAGTLTGTISAANVSAGEFGANTGGGNYSFPSKLSVGTSTILGPLYVATGTVDALVVADNGNVGIGTTTPGALLDIYHTGSENKVVTITQPAGVTNTNLLRLVNLNENSRADLWFWTGVSTPYYANIGLKEGGRLTFTAGGSSALSASQVVIQQDGNVGIGTTGPEGALQITGASAGSAAKESVTLGLSGDYASMELKGASSTVGGGFIDFGYPSDDYDARIIYYNSSKSFQFVNTAGSIYMNSNVGIGTTSPGAKLHVAGTGRFDGDVNFNSYSPQNAFIDYKETGGNYNIVGYIGDSFYKADARWTVTNGNVYMFDGRPDTSANYGNSTDPLVVTIDWPGALHYWYAWKIHFTWNRYTKHFKVERLRDTDGSTNGACDGGSDEVWETIAEPTDFSGYDWQSRSGGSSWLCAMRFTFYRNGTADLAYDNDLRIGEIAGWQYYYNSETGPLVSANGDTIYGNIDMNSHKITNLAAPTDANDAATKAYVDAATTNHYIVTTRDHDYGWCHDADAGAYYAAYCPSGWTTVTYWHNLFCTVTRDYGGYNVYRTQTLCVRND